MSTRTLSCIVLAAVVGLWSSIPAQEKPGNTSNDKGRVFDQEKKFSFVPPSGWDREEQSRTSILARRSSKSEGNVGVARVKAKKAAAVLKKELEAGRDRIAGFQLDEDGEVTIDGLPTYYMFFSHTRGAEQAGYDKLYAAVYMIINGDEYYRLTYTIMPGSYEKLKSEIKKSAESSKINR